MGLVRDKGGIVLGFGFVDDNWSLDARLIDLGLHIDDHVLLGLLHGDTLLNSHVGSLQSIFVLRRQICLAQLERLDAGVALFLHYLF